MAHVLRDVREPLRALAQVDVERDLSVKVDGGARAAIAVEQKAAEAPLARVRLLMVLAVERENEPAHMKYV